MYDSLLGYYGLMDQKDIIHHTIQSQIDSLASLIPEKNEQFEALDNSECILFFSIKTTSFLERKLSISKLLKHKFGIVCKTIHERQITLFDGIIRICAVSVFRCQSDLLLDVLFKLPNRSFALIGIEQSDQDLIYNLLEEFGDGILTHEALAKCCKTAVLSNSSFLHVLRGCDGFSINIFYRYKDLD